MDETGMGIKIITGGVTAARGFKAASTAAGIKYKDRQDMAMIYSQEPCRSAGTFTTNIVKAAPVKWDKNQVTSGAPARAVVINAGIANACTGEEGMGYCGLTASWWHPQASSACSCPWTGLRQGSRPWLLCWTEALRAAQAHPGPL